ncbi:MAG: UDP-3-O-(3-hydroxymyristoyl)glucosamine N-acyltransferase [Chthoniobacteraceae bacterium]|nr:UDP-3-O-(3-hydroxymyristoyl)glucosamine N-acyltransferase [Chthoniobacteraceae bacterium]
MDASIEELAALVGGRVIGGPSATHITGAAAIADAQEGDITFFGNAKYLPALRASRATCALVPDGFDEAIPAVQIQVANPTLAFSKILEQLAPPPIVFAPGIHPSAVIAADARIGKDVAIQAHVVVEPGAVIGDRTVLGPNVYIGHGTRVGDDCKIYASASIRERCRIGNRVIIHSGAVLGSDGFGFEMANGRYVKIPQTGIVQIDDDVEIGANTTIDRARFGRTWIGEGSKIDNLVQIAHNVVIGKHSIIVSQVGISGSSRIGNYATLAGQVGVVGHIEIGDQAVVAAKSGVSKSIPAKQMWWGSPAGPIQEQKEQHARLNRLAKLMERVKRLEEQVAAKGTK